MEHRIESDLNVSKQETERLYALLANAGYQIGQFVIVRFWAPWCSSCRANEVTVKSVLNQKADICTAFKVNVDREPELTRHLNVQYLPELIIFDREGKAHHLTGEVTEQVMLSHVS